MAVVPALAYVTVGVENKGEMCVNTPNALEGNHIEVCNTASGDFRSKVSGEVDGLCEDDFKALVKIRRLVSMLPSNNKEDAFCMSDISDDLNRENGALGQTKDTAYILQDISDNGNYFEVKENYAREMVTALIRLNGHTVGAVANREEVLGEDGAVTERFEPVLTSDGAKKAESFIRFCDAFSIPVLTLVNVGGFKASVAEEEVMAPLAAKLTYAYASATVPTGEGTVMAIQGDILDAVAPGLLTLFAVLMTYRYLRSGHSMMKATFWLLVIGLVLGAVGIIGDGGFLMGHSDLLTSIQEGHKINVLLFNNSGHQCIHNLERSQGMGTFGTEFRFREQSTGGLTGSYVPVNYAKLASAYGVKTWRVTTLTELHAAIEASKQSDVSTLIEIMVLSGTMTEGYENFWRVGTASVAEKESVRKAYEKLNDVVKNLRKY